MPEYDNNLRGVLFQNEKTKDTQPDYRGSCKIEGKDYWMSGWKKLSKDGKPFLSVSFQLKEVVADTQSGYEKAQAQANKLRELEDDDKVDLSSIPF